MVSPNNLENSALSANQHLHALEELRDGLKLGVSLALLLFPNHDVQCPSKISLSFIEMGTAPLATTLAEALVTVIASIERQLQRLFGTPATEEVEQGDLERVLQTRLASCIAQTLWSDNAPAPDFIKSDPVKSDEPTGPKNTKSLTEQCITIQAAPPKDSEMSAYIEPGLCCNSPLPTPPSALKHGFTVSLPDAPSRGSSYSGLVHGSPIALDSSPAISSDLSPLTPKHQSPSTPRDVTSSCTFNDAFQMCMARSDTSCFAIGPTILPPHMASSTDSETFPDLINLSTQMRRNAESQNDFHVVLPDAKSESFSSNGSQLRTVKLNPNSERLLRGTMMELPAQECVLLCQRLLRVLLGVQNVDVQRFQTYRRNRRATTLNTTGQPKQKISKRTRNMSQNTNAVSARQQQLSGSVCRLLTSSNSSLKVLYATVAPSLLNLTMIFSTLCRISLKGSSDSSQHAEFLQHVEDELSIPKADLDVFHLLLTLTHISLVVLAEDPIDSAVRRAAVTGLRLLLQLPYDVPHPRFVSIGLKKASITGGPAIKDSPSSSATYNSAATGPKWKRALRYKSSSLTTFSAETSSGYSSTEPPNSRTSTSPPVSSSAPLNASDLSNHSLLEATTVQNFTCENCHISWDTSSLTTHNTRTPKSNTQHRPCCIACGSLRVQDNQLCSTTSAVPPELTSFASLSYVTAPQLCIHVPIELCITQALDTLFQRRSLVSVFLNSQLTLPLIFRCAPDSSASIESEPPFTNNAQNRDSGDPMESGQTFPPHGWLLRVLDDTDSPRVRSEALRFLADFFTRYSQDQRVSEPRYAAHLPLLRSLLDSSPKVVQSALDTIAIASKIAPLKDGAVKKIIHLLLSNNMTLWIRLILDFFPQCCFSDATALKALIKGIMASVALPRDTSARVMLPTTSRAASGVTTEPQPHRHLLFVLQTNVTSLTFQKAPQSAEDLDFRVWFQSEALPAKVTNNTHNWLFWLHAFLRCCFIVGARHSDLSESFFHSLPFQPFNVTTGTPPTLPQDFPTLETLGLLVCLFGLTSTGSVPTSVESGFLFKSLACYRRQLSAAADLQTRLYIYAE